MSAYGLKIIAAVCMFLDHLGASVVERYIQNNPDPGCLSTVDIVLRAIGRAAFPLYCFLLVEGFLHTKNLGRYILRIGIFAVLSEIPFDLVCFTYAPEAGGVGQTAMTAALSMVMQHQNTLFTLLLGLLTIAVLRAVHTFGERTSSEVMRIILSGAAVIIGLVLAWFTKCDYGMYGYLSIIVIYQLIRTGVPRGYASAVSTLLLLCLDGIELFGLLAVLPVCLYSGERGSFCHAEHSDSVEHSGQTRGLYRRDRNGKLFFYFFYPLHFLLLTGICLLMRSHGVDMGWFITDIS